MATEKALAKVKEVGWEVELHDSDLYTYSDYDGNHELFHPSGSMLKVGENPEHEEIEPANRELTRNKDKQVHVRLRNAVNGETKVQLTFNPDGTWELLSVGNGTITSPNVYYSGDIQLTQGSINVVHGDVVAQGVSLLAGGSSGPNGWQAALQAHIQAADPHPVYLLKTNAASLYSPVGHTHPYQPINDLLTSVSGLTTSADHLIYLSGVNTAALTSFTAAARTLLAAADQAEQFTALGLGDSASRSVGTTAGTVAAGDHNHSLGSLTDVSIPVDASPGAALVLTETGWSASSTAVQPYSSDLLAISLLGTGPGFVIKLSAGSYAIDPTIYQAHHDALTSLCALGSQGPGYLIYDNGTFTLDAVGPQGLQGAQGFQGVQGSQGAQGVPGPGLPSGGTQGQIPIKASSTDFDLTWTSTYGSLPDQVGLSGGTYTKVLVDAKGFVTAGTTLSASDIPNLDWSKITSGKPTTLAGYGITDAQALNANLTSLSGLLGYGVPQRASDGSWTLLDNLLNFLPEIGFVPGVYTKFTVNNRGVITAADNLTPLDIPELPWSKITSGKPTTLSGYGITDGQPLSTRLTAIANVASATGFLYHEAGVWSFADASVALLDSGIGAGTYTKVTFNAKGLATYGTTLSASDIPNLDWSKITSGKPTTLAGYGITDAQPYNANLNQISGLSGYGHLKKTSGGTWTFDTNVISMTPGGAGFLYRDSSGNWVVDNTVTSGSSSIDWSRLTSIPLGVTVVASMTSSQLSNLAYISSLSGIGFAQRNSDGTWSLTQTTLIDTGVDPGTYTKVTVDSKGRVTAGTTLSTSDIPNLDWSKITSGKPTTLAGYGITDAQPYNANLTAISSLVTFGDGFLYRDTSGNWVVDNTVLSGSSQIDWSRVINRPTTRAGYGITDAQALNSNLTYISAFSGVSTGFLKRATDGTWSLTAGISLGDIADSGVTPGTFTKFTVNSKGVITYAEYLHDSDIPTLDWGKITTGKPTTLAGYGITDGQPLNADLTAIAALTGTGYPLRASDGTWSLQNISAMADQTYTPGTYTKVTVNIKGIVTGVATLSASDIPNLDWSKITSGKPTTVSGYGITITNSDLPNNIDWVKLVNKPTTLAGYGITDGQTLNANLTAISAFSGTTTGFPKRASDGSWSLQDIPTLDTTGVTAGTWTKVTVDVYGRVTLGTVLNSSDIPNLDWSKISTGKPTTLAGYGITDGQGLNANLTSISGLSGTGYLLRSGGGVWSVGLIDTTLLPNSGVTAGTYTKVTVNIKGIVTGVATLAASDIPNLDWTKITSGKPTTLAGYGITDAQALNANLTSISAFTGASTGFAVRASDGSWSLQSISVLTPTGVSPGTYTKVTVDLNGVVTAATTLLASDIPNLDWTKITTGKPTTLAGYGITDGQPLNADLTAIAALTGTGYPKRASDGSWTLDTLTTLDDIVSPGTYTKVTVTAQGRVSSGGSLVASDIPNLDWSKITTGIPSTLSGYGITDAQQKLGRSSIQVVTASLAVGATEQGSVALGKTFMLHKVVASAPCWIRIYATTAYRTADALRDVSTDPTGEHGVIAELLLVSGNLAYDLFPMVIGSNMDSPISTAIAYSITNTGLSTAAITVTFTRTVLET